MRRSRSLLLAWAALILTGLLLILPGATALWRLTGWSLGTILIDALGGPWLGYLALLAGSLGFLRISPGWTLVFPILVGCLWIYLILKHAFPRGAELIAALGYLLPFLAFKLLGPKLDRSIHLGRTPVLLLIASDLVGSLLALLIARLRRRDQTGQRRLRRRAS